MVQRGTTAAEPYLHDWVCAGRENWGVSFVTGNVQALADSDCGKEEGRHGRLANEADKCGSSQRSAADAVHELEGPLITSDRPKTSRHVVGGSAAS